METEEKPSAELAWKHLLFKLGTELLLNPSLPMELGDSEVIQI